MIEPLEYPKGFHNISAEVKARVCNGAGAAGGIKVPNALGACV